MSTISTQFEIEPYGLELEYEFEQERGGRGGSRSGSPGNFRGPKPRPRPKPWPNFRQRRDRDRRGGAGGYYPDPAAVLEPMSAAPSEQVRWIQSTLNRAIGAALPVDGVMSASVRDAIREFQRRNRLPASGYVGPDTDAALRRVGGSGTHELEFQWESEWESELSGDAKTADDALSWNKARPIKTALSKLGEDLKRLGKNTTGGLYRFYAPDRHFYTGMATDLRRRIIQHIWCLSHLGVETKTYKLAYYLMDRKTRPEIRGVEKPINTHHINQPNTMSLNKRAELEILELMSL